MASVIRRLAKTLRKRSRMPPGEQSPTAVPDPSSSVSSITGTLPPPCLARSARQWAMIRRRSASGTAVSVAWKTRANPRGSARGGSARSARARYGPGRATMGIRAIWVPSWLQGWVSARPALPHQLLARRPPVPLHELPQRLDGDDPAALLAVLDVGQLPRAE